MAISKKPNRKRENRDFVTFDGMALETSILPESEKKAEKNASINWRKVIKLEYEKLNKRFDSKKSTDIR